MQNFNYLVLVAYCWEKKNIQTKPKNKSTKSSTKTYQLNLVVIYSLSRPIYFLQHKNPTGNGWDSYMAVKNQTHPETKLSTKSKSSEFSFNLLIKLTNFIFLQHKNPTGNDWDSFLAEKKTLQPNQT